MPWNLTNATARQDIVTFFVFGNEVSNGWLGVVILLLVFLVPYRGLVNTYGSRRAVAAASFIASVTAMPLLTLGLIPGIGARIVWIICAASVVWLIVDKS